MLEKYKMENIVKFSVIILAFVFIGNWYVGRYHKGYRRTKK